MCWPLSLPPPHPTLPLSFFFLSLLPPSPLLHKDLLPPSIIPKLLQPPDSAGSWFDQWSCRPAFVSISDWLNQLSADTTKNFIHVKNVTIQSTQVLYPIVQWRLTLYNSACTIMSIVTFNGVWGSRSLDFHYAPDHSYLCAHTLHYCAHYLLSRIHYIVLVFHDWLHLNSHSSPDLSLFFSSLPPPCHFLWSGQLP